MEIESGREEDAKGHMEAVEDPSHYQCESCESYFFAKENFEGHACPGSWDPGTEGHSQSDSDSGCSGCQESPSSSSRPGTSSQPGTSSMVVLEDEVIIIQDVVTTVTVDRGGWESKSESESDDDYDSKVAKLLNKESRKREMEEKALSDYIKFIISKRAGISAKMFEPDATQEEKAEWASKILKMGIWEPRWMSQWARDRAVQWKGEQKT